LYANWCAFRADPEPEAWGFRITQEMVEPWQDRRTLFLKESM
jgi:pyridoxine/pyridoxamine 5'-phosphate oxidase